MPQLMKIISGCEKTRRGGPVAFLQQISSEREGIEEEGGRAGPLLFLGPQIMGVDLY